MEKNHDGASGFDPQGFSGSLQPGMFANRPVDAGLGGPLNDRSVKRKEMTPSFFGRTEGFEALDDSDFFIPRFKLVQPGGEADGEKAGRFRICVPGDEGPAEGFTERECLDMIPLKVQRGRVCWGSEFGADPICRSADNLVPDPHFWRTRPGNPPSGLCGRVMAGRWRPVCPLAQWSGGARPPCDLVYNLLFLDAKDRLPFLMSYHGAAVKPVRGFLTRLVRLRLKRLSDVTVRLSARKVEGPEWMYYVPGFSNIRLNGEGEYDREYEALKDYDPRRTFEAEMTDGNGSPSNFRALTLAGVDRG